MTISDIYAKKSKSVFERLTLHGDVCQESLSYLIFHYYSKLVVLEVSGKCGEVNSRLLAGKYTQVGVKYSFKEGTLKVVIP